MRPMNAVMRSLRGAAETPEPGRDVVPRAAVFAPAVAKRGGAADVWLQVLEVAAWCGGTAILGFVLALVLPFLSITNLFLLPVVAVSLRLGLVPALAATAIGLLSGMLFYEPFLAIEVSEPRDVVDLVVFAVIGVTLSLLGDGLRRTTLALRRRQDDLSSLYALSHDMARAADRPALLAVLASHLSRTVDHPVAVLDLGSQSAAEGAPVLPEAVRAAVPEVLPATEHETAIIRSGAEVWVVAAIGQASGQPLAVAARLEEADAADGEAMARIRSMLADAASSMERLGVAHALEQQQLRDKAEAVRNSLLDAASHELRTPLATILGTLTALRQAPPVEQEGPLRDIADLAADECRRLDRVIQTILDAGRIRSGEIVVRPTVVESADLVDVALRHSSLRLRDHTVVRQLPADPPLVSVDPVLVEQALVNILENAAKYSPAGSVITVLVEARGDKVAIAVTDQGAGLAPGEVDEIFGRFYRGDQGRTIAGSGLGLSIARAFVDASGGSITVASDGPGRGTTFTLLLPRQAAQDDHADDL
jgi:two-component system, OmpR family, sensor histidine kinase KdpD